VSSKFIAVYVVLSVANFGTVFRPSVQIEFPSDLLDIKKIFCYNKILADMCNVCGAS